MEPVNKNLIGEWRLDSISGHFNKWNDDYIYITDKNTFWKFTYQNDKYLIDSCLFISGNSVLKNKRKHYDIDLIDSLNIVLKDKEGNTFYYKNQDRFFDTNFEVKDTYKSDLKDFITSDSLHRLLVNKTWRLKKSNVKNIRLPNYGQTEEFSIFFNKNGFAKIYLNNKSDSIVEYNWEVRRKKISFGRGCIQNSNSPVYSISKETLTMSFNAQNTDTLVLVKSKKIQ